MPRPERRKRREPKYYLIVPVVILATLVAYISLIKPDLKAVETGCPSSSIAPTQLNVQLSKESDLKFDLEYAKTPTQQSLGLSLRPCLPKNAAILFLFATDDKQGIWMKEMKFPIDVVWLNSDKKVVKIVKNMLPSSYETDPPTIYRPDTDSRYVLEFNKGTADVLKLKEGSHLNW
jgi:uncharacterized protein